MINNAIITHFIFFHIMNLNVFHGDVNHKNDVSGRLKLEKKTKGTTFSSQLPSYLFMDLYKRIVE